MDARVLFDEWLKVDGYPCKKRKEKKEIIHLFHTTPKVKSLNEPDLDFNSNYKCYRWQ